MKLLTKKIETQLIKNHRLAEKGFDNSSLKPVVKFFGGGACTWLVTEYNPEAGLFFGLCDLGLGEPELGYIDRRELEKIRFRPFGLPVERDRFFSPDKSLTEYAKEARENGRVLS